MGIVIFSCFTLCFLGLLIASTQGQVHVNRPKHEDMEFVPPIIHPFENWEKLAKAQAKDCFGFDLDQYYFSKNEIKDKKSLESKFFQRKQNKIDKIMKEGPITPEILKRLPSHNEQPYVHKKLITKHDIDENFGFEHAQHGKETFLNMDMTMHRGLVNLEFLSEVQYVLQREENFIEVVSTTVDIFKRWIPGTVMIVKDELLRKANPLVQDPGQPHHFFMVLERREYKQVSAATHTLLFKVQRTAITDTIIDGDFKFFQPDKNQLVNETHSSIDRKRQRFTNSVSAEVQKDNNIDFKSIKDYFYPLGSLANLNYDPRKQAAAESPIKLLTTPNNAFTIQCTECYATLEFGIYFQVSISWGAIKRFLYASGGRFKMSYTLEAEFNQKWSTAAEKELFALNLGKLTFWIYFVPLWFDLRAGLKVGYSAEFSLQLQASTSATYEKAIWIGAEYNDGKGIKQLFSSGSDGDLFRLPQMKDVSASASATLGITFNPWLGVKTWSLFEVQMGVHPEFKVPMKTMYPKFDANSKCVAGQVEYSTLWTLGASILIPPIKTHAVLGGKTYDLFKFLPMKYRYNFVEDRPFTCQKCSGCVPFMSREQAKQKKQVDDLQIEDNSQFTKTEPRVATRIRPGFVPKPAQSVHPGYFPLEGNQCDSFYYESFLGQHSAGKQYLDIEIESKFPDKTIDIYYGINSDNPTKQNGTAATLKSPGLYGIMLQEFNKMAFTVCNPNSASIIYYGFVKINEGMEMNTTSTPDIEICEKCAFQFIEKTLFEKYEFTGTSTPKLLIDAKQTQGKQGAIQVFSRPVCDYSQDNLPISCKYSKIEFTAGPNDTFSAEIPMQTYNEQDIPMGGNIVNRVYYNTTVYSKMANSAFNLKFTQFHEATFGKYPTTFRSRQPLKGILVRYVLPPQDTLDDIEYFQLGLSWVKDTELAFNTFNFSDPTSKIVVGYSSIITTDQVRELTKNKTLLYIVLKTNVAGTPDPNMQMQDYRVVLFPVYKLYSGVPTRLRYLPLWGAKFELQGLENQMVQSFRFILKGFFDEYGQVPCVKNTTNPQTCEGILLYLYHAKGYEDTAPIAVDNNGWGVLDYKNSYELKFKSVELDFHNSNKRIWAIFEFQAITTSDEDTTLKFVASTPGKSVYFVKVPPTKLQSTQLLVKGNGDSFIPRFETTRNLNINEKRGFPKKDFTINMAKEYYGVDATNAFIATTGSLLELPSTSPNVTVSIECGQCILKEGDTLKIVLKVQSFLVFDTDIYTSKRQYLLNLIDSIKTTKISTDANPAILAQAIALARTKIAKLITDNNGAELKKYFDINPDTFDDLSIIIPLTKEIQIPQSAVMKCYTNETVDIGKFTEAVFFSDTQFSLIPLSTSPSICINQDYYLKCHGMFSTDASVCSGHGSCTGADVCTCNSGWTGPKCEQIACFGTPAANLSEVCSSHGKCTGPDTCSCSTGWVSPNCQTHTCFGIPSDDEKVCNGKGTCSAMDQCSCENLWFGNECKLGYCFDKKGDDPSVCSSQGSCIGQDQCRCKPGFQGKMCEALLNAGADPKMSSVLLLFFLVVLLFV